MKEATLKRLYTIQFRLYYILEKDRHMEEVKRSMNGSEGLGGTEV